MPGGGRPEAVIYLDYQATTPLAPEALAAMRPWLEEHFANPHSPHRPGREAAAAVAVAHMRVAAPFADEPGRLFFTSGATESANWALKGAAMAAPAGRRGIVTIATEHACVLDTVDWLGRQGFTVTVLPVGPDGLVDLNRAAAAIDEGTLLVAAMLVNNEIGVRQPIAALSGLARAAGALFFCDAAQGYGRVPVPVAACDMIALSAHKIHGPKGIGALWLRDGVTIAPLLHGGGQEGGMRSGTLSPALCVGFGAAAALAAERIEADAAHVEALWVRARAGLPGWTLNGAADPRWHGNLNVRHARLDAARLISDLRELAFSAGSACASGSGRPSHVLRASGRAAAAAPARLPRGFGR
jgi:cysteine desulfurase